MRELNGNGLAPHIAQAIEGMKSEQGEQLFLDHINQAELERRSGVSCGKLRWLKRKGFVTYFAAQREENTLPQNSSVILAS